MHFQPKAWRPDGPVLWIGSTLHRAALRRAVRYGSGYFPVETPPREDLDRLYAALRDAGRDTESYEIGALAGTDTPFPGPDEVKPLGATIEAASELLTAGVTTVFLKPSQFIDDSSQLEEFSRDALGMLAELAREIGPIGTAESLREGRDGRARVRLRGDRRRHGGLRAGLATRPDEGPQGGAAGVWAS